MSYLHEMTMTIKQKALQEGLRVFIAKNGTANYGLITDELGSLVISFWPGIIGMNFATCHKSTDPLHEGRGTFIKEEVCDVSVLPYKAMVKRNTQTPKFARPETLVEHLKEYNKSSQYKEVF